MIFLFCQNKNLQPIQLCPFLPPLRHINNTTLTSFSSFISFLPPSAEDGDYWRLLNPGTHIMTATAKGFSRVSKKVHLPYHMNKAGRVDFVLEKVGSFILWCLLKQWSHFCSVYFKAFLGHGLTDFSPASNIHTVSINQNSILTLDASWNASILIRKTCSSILPPSNRKCLHSVRILWKISYLLWQNH